MSSWCNIALREVLTADGHGINIALLPHRIDADGILNSSEHLTTSWLLVLQLNFSSPSEIETTMPTLQSHLVALSTMLLPLASADCNAGACAGAITGAISATAGAAVVCPVPGLQLAVCVPAVVGSEAAWATVGGVCGGCSKVDECPEDDVRSYNMACVSI